MGGKVAKKLGDGLMALFGYPAAQENDAERAVRAALSIQRSLIELNRRNADLGKPALVARIANPSPPPPRRRPISVSSTSTSMTAGRR
jgi:class 3 adenylate cyclase